MGLLTPKHRRSFPSLLDCYNTQLWACLARRSHATATIPCHSHLTLLAAFTTLATLTSLITRATLTHVSLSHYGVVAPTGAPMAIAQGAGAPACAPMAPYSLAHDPSAASLPPLTSSSARPTAGQSQWRRGNNTSRRPAS